MPDFNFTRKSFDLLEEFEQNNEREWYHAHKDELDEYLRKPFAQLLEVLSAALSGHSLPLRGGKHTMFRMARDLRFADDDTPPYKTSVSGLLTPSGTKSEDDGVLYLQLDSSGGMRAAGHYRRTAKQLMPIRTHMVEAPDQWRKVRKSLKKAGLQLQRDHSLTNMPRGFEDYADHEFAEDLKLQSLVIMADLPKTAWIKGDVVDRVIETVDAVEPLLRF